MGVFGSLLFFALAVAADLGSPVTIVWGWSRWRKRQRPVGKLAIASATGLALATASALLVVLAAAYARMTALKGFAYFTPPVTRFYAIGASLSLAGLALALVGVWRRNPVRWLAIAAAICTLLFWLIVAGGE